MSAPAPLGNTPTGGGGNNPPELQTDGLVYMGAAPDRGEQPVIVFYRTLEFGRAFAPDPLNIDKNTGQPKLVYPVTLDMFFPNGPLVGRVYRRQEFINAGITPPVRKTTIGSINVGQLAVAKPARGNPYVQLNALDADALAWATQIHQAAGGNVFRHYDPAGEAAPASAVNQAPNPALAPVADRFAGMPVPGAGGGQQQPAGPPPGMPGAGAPPAGFPAPDAQTNGQAPAQGQPQPTTLPPPPGVPNLAGQQQDPPAGFPGAGGPPPGFPPPQG